MSGEASHFPWHYGELDDKNFQLHDRTLLLVLLLLLAVVLLVVVLCFYFRRPCRLRAAATTATAGGCSTEEAAVIRRIPVRVRGKEAAAAACSICLSLVAEGEKESVLPGCDHGFHPECIDEWLRKQSSCPLCRAKVVGEVENFAPAAEDVPAAVV